MINRVSVYLTQTVFADTCMHYPKYFVKEIVKFSKFVKKNHYFYYNCSGFYPDLNKNKTKLEFNLNIFVIDIRLKLMQCQFYSLYNLE